MEGAGADRRAVRERRRRALIVLKSVPSYCSQTCSGTIGIHGGTVGANVGFSLFQISVVSSGVSNVGLNGR